MNRQSLRLARWHVLRYIAQHRLLAALNVVSVALGVAVYLAIQIANHSANRAFEASIDIVAGKADLQITAAGADLPETIYPAVAHAEGVAAATPLVRGFVTLPDFPGEYLQLLGLDIFTNASFRTFELAGFEAGEFDVQQWLGEGDAIAISEEFARAHRLRRGDAIRAQVNGADRQLRVSLIMHTSGGAAVDAHFAAMDIGWAQELFGTRGNVTEIQVQLADREHRKETIARLQSVLPPNASVASPAQRGEQVENMLGGFQLNLTAMSLVSLLVGMFLIYNTVSASVVRRRREIGILRSLGVTRNEVRALFLGEAMALGSLGVVVGIVGGIFLARMLVGTVSDTISSLYVLLSVRDVAIAPWMFASAAVLGLLSVAVAAWLPAAAAAGMHPVRALHGGAMLEEATDLSPSWSIAGVTAVLLAVGCSVLALTSGPPWIGFGAAFFVLSGFSLLVPNVTLGFSAATARWLRTAMHALRRPLVEPQLAAANLSRALVRNAITIAALAAAVAMSIGVSVMVFSFRRTVESWITETLVADVFIAPASNELVGPSSFIPPEAIAFFAQHPFVAAVDTFREIEVPMGEKSISVAVIRGSERRRLRFLRGDDEEIMRRFYSEPCVLVSESFARKNRVGSTIELITPEGPRQFAIAGTFYDYTRDEGVVFMAERTFLPLWKDTRVNSLAIYLKPNASVAELSGAFRSEFSRTGQFMILSNRELRTKIFEIFDQTFAVTYVLRTIAVIVAVVGICLTLTTLITERSRELGVLRAIGASIAQLRKLLLWESAMIGFIAAVVGLASGICLSFVLTGVINRAFFGWTIQLAFPWRSLAFTPVWVVAASLVAGLLPAWRAGRVVVAESLRSE
ncbi:MAG: FtsX-like permease family protein [Chthoniobacterales bacterium]|nr:FtsX-like permease family protein [Chthoniobacterales bacterium]